MNLGIFTETYPGIHGFGGIGTYTKVLAESLCEQGHRVHVLLLAPEKKFVGDTILNGVFVHSRYLWHLPGIDRLSPGTGICWSLALEARRIVNKYSIDIFEVPNWGGMGLLLPAVTEVPVAVRLHTSAAESAKVENRSVDRQLRWEVRRELWQSRCADLLVTHSNAHAELMAVELGVDCDSIYVIPHGIPVYPDFVRSPRAADRKLVVFVGRLERRKGVLDLLHAVDPVLDHCPNVTFILIGEDRPQAPGGRKYESYAVEELSVRANRALQFLGRQPQAVVDRFQQEAEVFVAPSLYESFGLVFPEAMRWGTPVIGTIVGGIPEIVRNGATGLLVPPSRPDSLSQAISYMLNFPEAAAQVGQAGRLDVESRFSSERMASDVAGLYSTFLRRVSGRG